MAHTIIIPSRNIENLTACVGALRAAGETGRVLVINDGLGEWGSLPTLGVTYVAGEKPFCFARNMNIGIGAASPDDVVLLNDDAQFTGALPHRQFRIIIAMEKFGIIAATTNVTGYPQQGRREPPPAIVRSVKCCAFVAVYIPRRTVNGVGLLDERFTSYGGEDVDYCLRVREAGLRVGVSDDWYVDHASLPSTFRAAHPTNGAPGDCIESNRIGIEKWGDKWPQGLGR